MEVRQGVKRIDADTSRRVLEALARHEIVNYENVCPLCGSSKKDTARICGWCLRDTGGLGRGYESDTTKVRTGH